MSAEARGRLAYMSSPGVVEMREYALPELEPGWLMLEIVAAGVCGSEVHMFKGHHPLRELPLGHEFVGRILDAGPRPHDSAGAPLADRDLVTATYFESCLHCPACSRGDFHLCSGGYTKWLSPTDEPPHFRGGMATHYAVSPRQWVYRVPEGVTPLAAASANCALAQVLCAVDRAAVSPGEQVVIQGAGGLGLYATAACKERGAHVTVVDAAENRLATATAFGADHTVSMARHPDTEQRRSVIRESVGAGADVAFDFSGAPEAVVEGLALLRPGGRYIEVGGVLPGTEVTIDLGSLTRNGIALIPVIRYTPEYLREALDFLSRNTGRLPLERLVDGRYDLDHVLEALTDAAQRRVNRAVITFHER